MRRFLIVLAAALAAVPADARIRWHTDLENATGKARVALIKGSRTHDAAAGIRLRGDFAYRQKPGQARESLYYDVNVMTYLLRGTEYDPDFMYHSLAAGYRRPAGRYLMGIEAAHLRRMREDRVGRITGNSFEFYVADPEFGLERFGAERLHFRAGAGLLASMRGTTAETRYRLDVRYDWTRLSGKHYGLNLPDMMIFLEGSGDALDGTRGMQADIEGGVRIVFFPDADNSLSLGLKLYDSKNPFGYGDDGLRVDMELLGGPDGQIFENFLGNIHGQLAIGTTRNDAVLEADLNFDLSTFEFKSRRFVVVLNSVQRSSWGHLDRAEYNLGGGIETRDDKVIWGVYGDHRSTHTFNVVGVERSYNIVRVGAKLPGWDRGNEHETKNHLTGMVSVGSYADNTFKKSRDIDARIGVRVDGNQTKLSGMTVTPYLGVQVTGPTDHRGSWEQQVEGGFRYKGNSLFLRWNNTAFFGESGYGGVALRF